jgi:hypothetical protein
MQVLAHSFLIRCMALPPHFNFTTPIAETTEAHQSRQTSHIRYHTKTGIKSAHLQESHLLLPALPGSASLSPTLSTAWLQERQRILSLVVQAVCIFPLGEDMEGFIRTGQERASQ